MSFPGVHSERIVILALYRSLLRLGRKFDERPVTRALISYPLPFSFQVLLGGIDRDFYGNNMSVQASIQKAFRYKASYQTTIKSIDDIHGVREREINTATTSTSTSIFTIEDKERQKIIHRKQAEEENEIQLKIDLAMRSNATLSCLLNLIHKADYNQLPSTSSYSYLCQRSNKSKNMNTNNESNSSPSSVCSSSSSISSTPSRSTIRQYSFYDERRKENLALDKALILLEEAQNILNEENKLQMLLHEDEENSNPSSTSHSTITNRLKGQDCLHQEIKDLYESSVNLKPTAEGLTNLGWVYHLNGDTSQAMSYAKKSMEVDSTYGAAFNDYGLYLQKEGKFQDALEYYKEAVTKPRQRGFDKHDSAYINMGHLYLEVGDPLKALYSYLMALYYLPVNAQASSIEASTGTGTGTGTEIEVKRNVQKHKEIRQLIAEMASYLCKLK